MINDCITYLKQRFNLLLFSALAIYLILYSKNTVEISEVDFILFPFALVFLFIMRLYDDLWNESNDSEKGRVYSNKDSAKNLKGVLCLTLFVFLSSVFICDWRIGIITTVFFMINHLLYFFFFTFKGLSQLLPLLKYAVLTFVLSLHYNTTFIFDGLTLFPFLALFFAFIVFEILDDVDFYFKRNFILIFLLIPYLLLFANNYPRFLHWEILIISLTSIALSFMPNRTTPYVFLIMFLGTRIILLYEI